MDETISSETSAAAARLKALASEWKVAVSPAQAASLLAFGQLLLEWNRHINLTGATSLEGLFTEHFVDSFAIASRLPGRAAPLSVVDVGSGGGLPALPFAILQPDARLQLIEPIAKKAAFLRTAVRTADLGARVRVASERLDAFLKVQPEPFDIATSRATFHPDEWLVAASPLIRPGGTVFVLTSTSNLAPSPGWQPVAVIPYGANRRWLHELARST